MEKYGNVIPLVLKQISKVLSEMCGYTINLSCIGDFYMDENGKYSVELNEIDISSKHILKPFPQYSNDNDGFYKVNRIRLGITILNDTVKGYPFSDDEIKTVLKGVNVWGYIK